MERENEKGIKNAVDRLQMAEHGLLRARELTLKKKHVNQYRLDEINGKLSNVQAKLQAINKEYDFWGLL
jgi:hypothetical protein